MDEFQLYVNNLPPKEFFKIYHETFGLSNEDPLSSVKKYIVKQRLRSLKTRKNIIYIQQNTYLCTIL